MAKRRKPPEDDRAQPADKQLPEEPPSSETPPSPGAKKRHPSRARVKYAPLPEDLYQWLETYAESRSGPYDRKSVAWAARQAVYWFKQHVEKNQGSGPE